jgi:hypothetical protein
VSGTTISGAICGVIAIPIGSPSIAVITSNGNLYQGDNGGFVPVGRFSSGFTGAIAIYTDGTNSLLLLGSAGGGSYYTYGYREVVIDSTGNLSGSFSEPGGDNSSISNTPRYRSSLGRRVVRSMFQAPVGIDPSQPLFASTQSQGLWRYYRSKGEWNADDNSGG